MMAKKKCSNLGKLEKKIVPVKGCTKKDATKGNAHRGLTSI